MEVVDAASVVEAELGLQKVLEAGKPNCAHNSTKHAKGEGTPRGRDKVCRATHGYRTGKRCVLDVNHAEATPQGAGEGKRGKAAANERKHRVDHCTVTCVAIVAREHAVEAWPVQPQEQCS